MLDRQLENDIGLSKDGARTRALNYCHQENFGEIVKAKRRSR